MLSLFSESYQDANLIFAMVHQQPAPPTKTACTEGRGVAYQSGTGGWPTSTQGGTEGSETREERKAGEGSDRSEEEEDHDNNDEESKSSLSKESKAKEITKPPAETQAPT